MEQTLGKRIVEHRKRLGLTQDALAEKLSITAQAVSKWENDLSCPDISMLPKLAAIFGISTDELLGLESHANVHEAGVADDEADHSIINFSVNSRDSNDKWEFHWDSGRKHAVGFACWVLGMGILLLVNNLYDLNVSFWNLAWPSWLLMMGLVGGNKFSFTRLGFILVGGYFLVNNLGLMPFPITKAIIWPGMVILFGLSLLTDALRKPKKPRFSVTHKGTNSHKTKSDCRNHADRFVCSLSFGERMHLVEMPTLVGGEADLSFGQLTVDLTGCAAVADNCYIQANCAFGELNLLVPRRFAVQTKSDTAFGSIDFSGHPDSDPVGVIYLDANASFGEICVKYV